MTLLYDLECPSVDSCKVGVSQRCDCGSARLVVDQSQLTEDATTLAFTDELEGALAAMLLLTYAWPCSSGFTISVRRFFPVGVSTNFILRFGAFLSLFT